MRQNRHVYTFSLRCSHLVLLLARPLTVRGYPDQLGLLETLPPLFMALLWKHSARTLVVLKDAIVLEILHLYIGHFYDTKIGLPVVHIHLLALESGQPYAVDNLYYTRCVLYTIYRYYPWPRNCTHYSAVYITNMYVLEILLQSHIYFNIFTNISEILILS